MTSSANNRSIVARKVMATTAMLPGFTASAAMRHLQGVAEPAWGPIHFEHVQICPQNLGQITPAVCDRLRQDWPGTQFRLHANARVLPGHVRWDASSWSPETDHYYRALADRSRRLGSPAYSLHAGYAAQATLDQMFDHRHRIQDIFGSIPVAVEGLYPLPAKPQLVSTWSDYDRLLNEEVPMAIDMSHLKIVARSSGCWQEDLVRALLASKHCLEVHVSENDGLADRHQKAMAPPRWAWMLDHAHPEAICFSEGDHGRSFHPSAASLPSL